MDVAWASFCEESGARNLVSFPCKVIAADDERYLVRAAAAAAAIPGRVMGSTFVFCND